MLVITAPSKTQSWIDRRHPVSSTPAFAEKSRELIEILKEYTVDDLCLLMGISQALGENTHRRIHEFSLPFSPDKCRQAIFTFRGDAYADLTPEHYSGKQLDHAQRHLRILSGLYGLLRPLDLIYPYRLEMGCPLSTGQWKNLYVFWGESITERLNEDCRSHRDQTVVNLASAEYSRAIIRKKLVPRLITVTFRQRRGDGYATIPIHAKRARGLMMHYVIDRQLSAAEELLGFDLAGYRLDRNRSSEDNWLFQQG